MSELLVRTTLTGFIDGSRFRTAPGLSLRVLLQLPLMSDNGVQVAAAHIQTSGQRQWIPTSALSTVEAAPNYKGSISCP